MNWSFAQRVIDFAQEAERGQKVPDSQVQSAASFNMGFNIAVTPRITTNVVRDRLGLPQILPDFAFSLTVTGVLYQCD